MCFVVEEKGFAVKVGALGQRAVCLFRGAIAVQCLLVASEGMASEYS